MINKFFEVVAEFDVLILSGNTIKELNTNFDFLKKTIDSQTTSGYCVSKKFAPILLENYQKSVEQLEKIGYRVPEYCLDMFMKKLQPISLWYSLYPKIGMQMESYSDIEKCVVVYNC